MTRSAAATACLCASAGVGTQLSAFDRYCARRYNPRSLAGRHTDGCPVRRPRGKASARRRQEKPVTHRERFVNTMHYRPVDRIPIWDFGFWEQTLVAWRKQGMPEAMSPDEFFGMDKQWAGVPVNLGMIPPFEEVIYEQDEETQLVRDSAGVLCRRSRKGTSIPTFIEFPVKNRADFEAMQERHDANDPARYPDNWDELVTGYRTRDYALGIGGGGLFGWVRGWMGVENTCMCFHDDPQLVHDMMQFVADFVCRVIERALAEVELDLSMLWEDMAYNKTSLISPRMFREFMVPRYRQITRLLTAHGVDVNMVDCDGNIAELIPLWLEGGVNCMFPLEVGVWGANAVELAKQYGPQLLMMGNIGKRALSAGGEAIAREVMSKVPPLVKRGGYIPTPDHRVPPDVPLANYQYYLELVRQVAAPG